MFALAVMVAGVFALNAYREGPAVMKAHTWYGTTCMIDADGDDALDFVGLAMPLSASEPTLTVINGLDGTIRWKADAADKAIEGVVCIDANRFGTRRSDRYFELWDSRSSTRQPLARIAIGGSLYGVGVGEGCIVLQSDANNPSVSLATGQSQTECAVVHTRTLGGMEPGVIDLSKQTTLFEDESGVSHYDIQPDTTGTPTLTLRALAPSGADWSQRLPIAASDRNRVAAAATNDTIYIYGNVPGHDAGAIVAVSKSDGMVLFNQPQVGAASTAWLWSFTVNGRYLVMSRGTNLQASDLASGEVVWQFGLVPTVE